MVMNLIAELSCYCWNYHNKKSDKLELNSESYIYHVKMMGLYRDILTIVAKYDELKKTKPKNL